jgi:hypothetical protein
MSPTKITTPLLLLGSGLISSLTHADGVVIGKVYDPYVTLLEQEVEYRGLLQTDDRNELDGGEVHRLGYGRTLAERWFGEIYAIGEREVEGSTQLEAFEIEVKHQLTEQGEYAADWGWLTELERSTERNQWELKNTLIAARDWGRWTGTANASLIYEWGDHLDNELETSFSAQLKYRRNALLEPGVELFKGQDTSAIGPVVGGLVRVGNGKKLRWLTGVIAGLDSDTPDVNYKLELEFEF